MQKGETKYIPAVGYDRLSNFLRRTIRWTMPKERFRKRLVQSDHFIESTDAWCGLDVDPKFMDLAMQKMEKEGLEIQWT